MAHVCRDSINDAIAFWCNFLQLRHLRRKLIFVNKFHHFFFWFIFFLFQKNDYINTHNIGGMRSWGWQRGVVFRGKSSTIKMEYETRWFIHTHERENDERILVNFLKNFFFSFFFVFLSRPKMKQQNFLELSSSSSSFGQELNRNIFFFIHFLDAAVRRLLIGCCWCSFCRHWTFVFFSLSFSLFLDSF